MAKRRKRRRKNAAGRRLRIAGAVLLAVVAAPVIFTFVYRFAPPPGTLTMLERKLGGDTIIHPWTPIDEISPHLVRAVIAAEDSRFCLHGGIDFDAVEKALEEARDGKGRRGASTVSQQTVKNVFLWQGGGWFRKGVEAPLTLLGDFVWGKRRTMELYLNVAEWGDGYFGAEAAAQGRFGKSAKNLSKDEAALLAAVLPSPEKWRAVNPGPYVRGRASMLRKRMDVVRNEGLDACVLTQ
ncbi:MAG: monofunctional biosynthetic peptidoglycan transglycosylase [Parvularculaceae bacterium]